MKNLSKATFTSAVIAAFVLAGAASAGPDWVEDGDAGRTLETAQVINAGKGEQLSRIFGSLDGPFPTAGVDGDFQDVYQILITDPTELLFSTIDTSTNFQTSLWLFDSNGNGLLGNVFGGGGGAAGITGSQLNNFATDDSGIVISTPGIYYIAICGIGSEPTAFGKTMFEFDSSFEVSGPDGDGGVGQLTGWTSGDDIFGDYELRVQGVGFVPAPGAVSLLAIGMLGVSRRHRH